MNVFQYGGLESRIQYYMPQSSKPLGGSPGGSQHYTLIAKFSQEWLLVLVNITEDHYQTNPKHYMTQLLRPFTEIKLGVILAHRE